MQIAGPLDERTALLLPASEIQPHATSGEDATTPLHMLALSPTHEPISQERQEQVRAMMAAGDTVELAMDATAIIGGLLAELDRKDTVLTRQGRNIGQLTGDVDLLRTYRRQSQPVIEAALGWLASKNAGTTAKLSAALHELVSELMDVAIDPADDGRQN